MKNFPCKHFFCIFYNILSSSRFKTLINMEMCLNIYQENLQRFLKTDQYFIDKGSGILL